MVRVFSICGLICMIGITASGQTSAPEHLLKLIVPAQKGIGLAYEFRPHGNSGLEVQLLFQHYNNTPEGLFHGDRVLQYAEQRTDSLYIWSGKPLNQGQWRYVGSSRPLPYSPEFLGLWTGYIRAGYQYYLPWASRNWRFFIRPGLYGGVYRYYSVADKTLLIGEIKHVEHLQSIQGAVRHDRKVFYEQTRSMRLNRHIWCGLTYDAGIVRMLGKHLFLEARGGLGLNFNPPPEAQPPVPVRWFSAQALLALGYRF